MDWRLKRINQELKWYDKSLVAKQCGPMVQVWRNTEKLMTEETDEGFQQILRPYSVFLFALTRDWSLRSDPVDWGLVPIMNHLREMDTWNKDSFYQDMVKKRDELKADKDRSNKNNIRAIAADCRKEFAEATNDIVVQR